MEAIAGRLCRAEHAAVRASWLLQSSLAQRLSAGRTAARRCVGSPTKFEVYAMKEPCWLIYRDKIGQSCGESVDEFAAHVTREVPKPGDWADEKTIGELYE